jgi:DNA polymerase-3 subunit alpha
MVEGKARYDEFSSSWRLTAQRIVELDTLREQQARRLVLTLPGSSQPEAQLDRLAEILGRWRGGPCPITIEYQGARAGAAFTLAQEWNVKPTRELIEQIEVMAGRGNVQIIFGPPPSISQTGSYG